MKKINLNEPLNDFLKRNIKKKPISFHMPGHKYGRFPYVRTDGKFAKYDITEITGADNIKKPEGVIKASMSAVSSIYGSDRSFYMTNGSTGGILTIMKYLSLKGSKVLVSRDSHMSVIDGAVLFGLCVEFIPTGFEKGIPVPAKADDVEKLLKKHKDVSAVLITSPNYYGFTAELKGIRKSTDERNLILVVDEAHGAHLQFTDNYSLSALENGADIVCHSLHKTLPVYNQGALLHVKGNRIEVPLIEDILNKLGTSSPSYPVMASMEKAVSYFNANGKKLYSKLENSIEHFKKDSIQGISYVENDDKTRIVIDISNKGLSGYEAVRKLSERGIDMEAGDFGHLIAICTPSNRRSDFRKLADGLEGLRGNKIFSSFRSIPGIPEKALEIHEAETKNAKQTALNKAEGSICGTIIIPYPPGIPCLYPGEIISGEMVVFLQYVISEGGSVIGLEKGMIPVLELT